MLALVRILFPAIVLALLLVMLITGSVENSRRAMMFPWLLGIFIGISLLVWQIVREVKARSRASEEEKVSAEQVLAFLTGIAWIIVILPLIVLFGYTVAVPLFTLLCFKLRGEKWFPTIMYTVFAGGIFYVAFVIALQVPFDQGLLFSW